MTAPTAPTPHDPSRHSARRSSSSSSAKKPVSTPPVFSVSKPPARWSVFFCHTSIRPSRGLPNHTANINRKCAADLESGRLRERRIGFPLAGENTLRRRPAQSAQSSRGFRMTARSSLTIVLAAGEGTRMRSVDAEGAASRGGPVAAGACAGCRPARRRRGACRGRRARTTRRSPTRSKRMRPDAATFVQRERLGTAHAVLAAREAIAPRRRRSAGRVRRYAADFGRNVRAAARAAGKGRGARRARLSRRRSDRLRPAADRGRPPGGDPRAGRCQRGGTQDHAVQCRRDGVRRPQGARNHRKDRQCQQQGRVLSDRCRRHRQRTGIGGRRDRNQRG